ncbi:hypothetical protein SAMD00019534_042140 [Acytostelium subglobosum LB1]|uniref:hypothetical protein n=1 Tax=Acytostelium subglobosum LB1 TaxID=1410327 RepID=UPI000644EE15|nr:hypothetical protein SAMD00019534_042140 [Acytostelium subglobosum LB1]GAM21039.1 hypothetical protein SAMD00019534_042140 [Acytostelium subglobosum LB1]|eukprot:XP_012756173.1 hypothetical protein SAMD00019534_042140 [Acytostelium subglobosum LB1]
MDRQSVVKPISTVIPFPLNFDNQKFTEMYKSYNKIMILARDLNTQIDVPEFVVVGKDGTGKSALIESFVGFPMGDAGATQRPLLINLVNNPQYERPRIVFKRDRFLPNLEVDKVVDLQDLAKEIGARNVKSSIPIKVQFEYRHVLNMQFIELPATADDDLVQTFARPTNRMLVFVNAATAAGEAGYADAAKRFDPKLDRSIFVFTKFHDHLKTFSNARDLNRYLSIVNNDAQTFFLTLPNADARAGAGNKELLAAALDELQKQDMELLEQLQFDRRFERNIGYSAFRHAVSEITWRQYQEAIPEVLKRLRAFRKSSEEQLAKLKIQLENMNAGKLRIIASNYVMEFLQSIEKLVVGTLEGNPTLNGQTLAEEKSQDETGEWVDHNHRAILFDAKTMNVPFHESKVYGGQQFERLLSEFKAISEAAELAELSSDEIATALGSNRPSNVSVLAWAASDIAQRKSKEALRPLIDQLFRRAVYILRRLVDIVDRMIENKRRAQIRRVGGSPSFESAPMSLGGLRSGSNVGPGGSVSGASGAMTSALVNIDDHPYFTYAIKEMYFKFIDQIVQTCKSKCIDEFYTTRLIYWELQNNDELKALSEAGAAAKTKDDTQRVVNKLAAKLFRDTKARITKNIMLKCFNYFLIPMQSDLWGEVQGRITILSDVMLEELFEVSVTKERLKEDERHLGQISVQFTQQEENFMLAANTFSHPVF